MDSTEGGSGALQQVALKYRDPLPESMLSTVRGALALGAIDCAVFVPLLREFASEQLCTDGWAADESLKGYLGYSSEQDLEELTWFIDSEILPDSLQLRHTFALYQLCVGAEQ